MVGTSFTNLITISDELTLTETIGDDSTTISYTLTIDYLKSKGFVLDDIIFGYACTQNDLGFGECSDINAIGDFASEMP